MTVRGPTQNSSNVFPRVCCSGLSGPVVLIASFSEFDPERNAPGKTGKELEVKVPHRGSGHIWASRVDRPLVHQERLQ